MKKMHFSSVHRLNRYIHSYIVIGEFVIVTLHLQSFPFNVGERVKLVERPEPLEMKRVDSIFKERIERHKEELAELEEETKVIRRPLPVRPMVWWG